MADKCGVGQKYRDKELLIVGGKVNEGEYMISDKPKLDSPTGRELTFFVYRDQDRVVSMIVHPEQDGNKTRAQMTVAVR